MIVALALASLAAPCDVASLAQAPETLSVAWVSPLGRRARGWIRVTRTSDVVALGTDLGRTLQGIGLRKRPASPSRRYKVTVFDVAAGDLCRAIQGVEPGAEVAGVAACVERLSKPNTEVDGCGHVIDRATSEPGIEVFHARWRDLAREGFCVLPAERFVGGL
jgi:hypothetical protein